MKFETFARLYHSILDDFDGITDGFIEKEYGRINFRFVYKGVVYGFYLKLFLKDVPKVIGDALEKEIKDKLQKVIDDGKPYRDYLNYYQKLSSKNTTVLGS